ncbi:hypothetical protein [Rhizocola hellebori]|uniref:hypothetical protein n=1 Tax=Rhizocola hellebori TaxID=1392758 RepID=UPI0019435160|nr:hypothetical protein [Rhizocola hellebori]
MDFSELTAAERKVWEAFSTGALVDLRELEAGQREVRGAVVAALALGARPDRELGAIPALNVAGARVTGQLQLGFASVEHPLMLQDCDFDQAPDLYWARLDFLRFVGCRMPGLRASHVQVARHLQLSSSVFTGEVRMSGAKIAGGLLLDQVELHGPDKALVAERLEVGGDLVMQGAKVTGGLRFFKSTIGGNLSLDDLTVAGEGGLALGADSVTVAGAVFCRRARITGELSLRHARTGGAVTLSASELSNPGGVAMRADRADLEGGLWLGVPSQGGSFRAQGQIRLVSAHVGRGLTLAGATLENPGGYALLASAAVIDGGLDAMGLHTTGGVNLSDSTISGLIRLDGAHLSHPGGEALKATRLTANSALHCAGGFRADGLVWLSGSTIGGVLTFHDAILSAPGQTALRTRRLRVPELVLRWREAPQGLVDLRFAQVEVLRDDPVTWPAEIRLDGMTYESVEPILDAPRRLRLLERDHDGYRPQPYEQLAAVCRRLGNDDDARTVLLARQRKRMAGRAFAVRLWGLLQEVTVGYGYRPMRAAIWLVLALSIGSFEFSRHPPTPVGAVKASSFEPIAYTADVLLPLIDLGQEKSFEPQEVNRWLTYTLVAVGWILVTTVAAGVARSVRRD